ncbi:MAG: DUF992 domain-containing protein [Candidatus Binataceae bacterium]
MSRPIKLIHAAVLAIVMAVGFVPAAAADGITTKTGMLTCHVASGFGWIIGSSRTVECEYIPWVGPAEHYSGTVSKIGLDLGYLAPVAILWAVIAPSTVPSGGALAGNYFGATAQAAVGIGGGVSMLLGGFQKSIALQPVTVEGDTGLYIGVGIASMSLKLDDH